MQKKPAGLFLAGFSIFRAFFHETSVTLLDKKGSCLGHTNAMLRIDRRTLLDRLFPFP